MEREVWERIVELVGRHAPAIRSRRFDYDWPAIVLTLLWAVVCTRPISWAVDPCNWPDDLRLARLPTNTTMSRRLRNPIVLATLRKIMRHLQRGRRRGKLSWIDGKALLVARHSRDPDAKFGGAGGQSKGYKLHFLAGENDRTEAFAIRTLSEDERVVARQLVREARLSGYLLGDKNYDANPLHRVCREQGVQLIAPRRIKGRLGHRRHDPARLRAIDLLEGARRAIGAKLFQKRRNIERRFGQLSSAHYGLITLPPWVRRLHRVERWTTASLLVFTAVRRHRKLVG